MSLSYILLRVSHPSHCFILGDQYNLEQKRSWDQPQNPNHALPLILIMRVF